jgi:ATP-binding cassette subfamily B multidrug efflux pump
MTAPMGRETAAPRTGDARRGDATLARFHEESTVEATYDAHHLARLWPWLRPYRAALFGSLGMLLLGSALAIARPLVMRDGLDRIGEDPGAIARAGLTLAAILVVEQLVGFPQMLLMQTAGARAMSDLRRHVFQFLHTRSLAFFDRTPVGRLVTRVTSDVDAIGEMFATGALNAAGDLVRLVVIVGVLLNLDSTMSLVAFATVPPVLVGVNWTRRRMRESFREVRAKTARMNAQLSEQVSGIAVVQAYAREAASAAEFDAVNDAYRRANQRSIVLDSAMDAAIEMVSSLCVAAVLWAAGVQRDGAAVSFGTLFAFVAYLEMFFVPIRDLSARYTMVQSAMAGAERVFGLLDDTHEDAPVVALPTAAAEPSTDAPAVELERIHFAYKPNVPVLIDVSLSVRSGERVALVGATGAGKSTVASLLLRLYEPQEGTIRVFGRDVRTLGRSALRKHFAVVPQDVFLFPGTVAENIAAGATPDRSRVVRALERVDALALFERREGGLDAQVGERGSAFSAGERQLIAFARALYDDPEILLLDEATANVDSETEARLSRAVERALEGRTAIVIAHRLSTIRASDRIVVFHKGSIVEQGTHDALLAENGVYARLHALQFAEGATVGDAAVPATRG